VKNLSGTPGTDPGEYIIIIKTSVKNKERSLGVKKKGAVYYFITGDEDGGEDIEVIPR